MSRIHMEQMHDYGSSLRTNWAHIKRLQKKKEKKEKYQMPKRNASNQKMILSKRNCIKFTDLVLAIQTQITLPKYSVLSISRVHALSANVENVEWSTTEWYVLT